MNKRQWTHQGGANGGDQNLEVGEVDARLLVPSARSIAFPVRFTLIRFNNSQIARRFLATLTVPPISTTIESNTGKHLISLTPMLVGNLNIFEPNILQSRNHAWTTDFAGPVTRLDFLSLHHCHISEACLVASQIFFLQSTDHGQILYVVPTGTNVFRLIQLDF